MADPLTVGSEGWAAGLVARRHVVVRAARLHHWLKNLLLFVPPLLAHDLFRFSILLNLGLAFLSFSLCASGAYLMNDFRDLETDRAHPTKRLRPLASGELSLESGRMLVPILLILSLSLTFFLPPLFLGVLALYFLSSVAYSWRLKRAALIDVLALAGLYTLRIIAGGVATGTPLSFWLLAFSTFVFLSLGLVKRYAELSTLVSLGGDRPPGRGYAAVDLESLAQFGSASAYISVLVLALYINSDSVRALYSNPEVIWLLCPLLLYLMSRIWLLARRGEVHEDPLLFIIEDRRTYLLAGLGVLVLWLAV
jgi:4-hydroxybenzoate polyprenyltransferase